jgi:hypothetical protein
MQMAEASLDSLRMPNGLLGFLFGPRFCAWHSYCTEHRRNPVKSSLTKPVAQQVVMAAWSFDCAVTQATRGTSWEV